MNNILSSLRCVTYITSRFRHILCKSRCMVFMQNRISLNHADLFRRFVCLVFISLKNYLFYCKFYIMNSDSDPPWHRLKCGFMGIIVYYSKALVSSLVLRFVLSMLIVEIGCRCAQNSDTQPWCTSAPRSLRSSLCVQFDCVIPHRCAPLATCVTASVPAGVS